MTGLSIPQAGWFAAKMMAGGIPVGLALLGIAVTFNGGVAHDDDVNGYFAQLAATDDSVYAVNEYYRGLEQEFPFLSGYLGAVTEWTEMPGDHQYEQVRALAAELSSIRWSEVEEFVGGDLLGRVHAHMLAIGARRTRIFDYVSIEEAYVGLIRQGAFLVAGDGKFLDAWCGSGTRVIAYSQLMADMDNEPEGYVLNDPSPTSIATAGLNMVNYQIPNVRLACDRAWAERWAATRGLMVTPAGRMQLPPELAHDVPALKKMVES